MSDRRLLLLAAGLAAMWTPHPPGLLRAQGSSPSAVTPCHGLMLPVPLSSGERAALRASAAAFINGISSANAAKSAGIPNLPRPGVAAVGDINGDGCQDVVQADTTPGSGSVQVLAGLGGASFAFYSHYRLTGRVVDIATFQGDDDPFADLAVLTTGAATELTLFSGAHILGGAAGPTRVPLPFPEDAHLVGPAAMVARGAAMPFDLAVSGRQPTGQYGIIAVDTSAAGWTQPLTARIALQDALPAAPTAMAFAPESSGALTLAVGTATAVHIYPVKGGAKVPSGLPASPRVLQGAAGPIDLDVTDVNGDGRSDVLALNRGSGAITTFIRSPTGYQAPTTSLAGVNAGSFSVLDFNNDGRRDIVVANRSASKAGVAVLSVLAGTEPGGFRMAKDFPASRGSVGAGVPVVAADLDRDGRDEILTLDQGRAWTVFDNLSGAWSAQPARLVTGLAALVDQRTARRLLFSGAAGDPAILNWRTVFDDVRAFDRSLGLRRETLEQAVRAPAAADAIVAKDPLESKFPP